MRNGIAYCSTTYSAAVRDLYRYAEQSGECRKRAISYQNALERTALPVHLLEASDTGALQLRIMSLPGYRQILSLLMLGQQFSPPDPNLRNTDALLDTGAEKIPFIMGADMDVKRIGRAQDAAKVLGYSSVAIGALSEQIRA